MDIGNLLSGFIGAVAAVFLQEIWKFFSVKVDRYKKKKIFKEYLSLVVKPSLISYIADMGKCTSEIENYPPSFDSIISFTYDQLPSLNNEVFKQIGFNELYFLTQDYILHSKIIDFSNSIDYLKTSLPFDIHNDFIDLCDSHFKEMGFENYDQVFDHSKTCKTVKDQKRIVLANNELRKQSATRSLGNINEIIKEL